MNRDSSPTRLPCTRPRPTPVIRIDTKTLDDMKLLAAVHSDRRSVGTRGARLTLWSRRRAGEQRNGCHQGQAGKTG